MTNTLAYYSTKKFLYHLSFSLSSEEVLRKTFEGEEIKIKKTFLKFFLKKKMKRKLKAVERFILHFCQNIFFSKRATEMDPIL